jgi:hypothetical protein
MASRKATHRRRLPFEVRLVWWLVALACKVVGRLPVWLLGLVGTAMWLVAWPFRPRPSPVPAWLPADAFYRSHRWRRLRIDVLEGNRERYGEVRCECCLTGATERWHVDHICPRSTHPELALEPSNLQVLCADCNVGKGARYLTDWRCENRA